MDTSYGIRMNEKWHMQLLKSVASASFVGIRRTEVPTGLPTTDGYQMELSVSRATCTNPGKGVHAEREKPTKQTPAGDERAIARNRTY